MDDEYEDEEDQWEEGAEDILEKGEEERELTFMQIGALTQEAGLSGWLLLNNQTRFMDDKDEISLMCIYS